MTRLTRTVFLALCAACLLAPVAMASQPAGLAGQIIAETYPSDFTCFERSRIKVYMYFGDQPLNPGDTLTLEIAIVPFNIGDTWITMDSIEGTFMGFSFADGNVTDPDGLPSGLRYNRFGWNDVTVVVRPTTQDFIVTVNGGQAGPFPFGDFCPHYGGCYSANALRIDTNTPDAGGAIAWIDTLSIAKDSTSGHEVFPGTTRTFDSCGEDATLQVVGGAVITGIPPVRMRTKK